MHDISYDIPAQADGSKEISNNPESSPEDKVHSWLADLVPKIRLPSELLPPGDWRPSRYCHHKVINSPFSTVILSLGLHSSPRCIGKADGASRSHEIDDNGYLWQEVFPLHETSFASY